MFWKQFKLLHQNIVKVIGKCQHSAAGPHQYGSVTHRTGSCLLRALEAGGGTGGGFRSRTLALETQEHNQKGQNFKAIIWKPSRLYFNWLFLDPWKVRNLKSFLSTFMLYLRVLSRLLCTRILHFIVKLLLPQANFQDLCRSAFGSALPGGTERQVLKHQQEREESDISETQH